MQAEFRIGVFSFYVDVTVELYPLQQTQTLISPLDGRASLNTIEVSRVTGMSPKTIRKYAAAGYIPGAFQRMFL
jgi:hypothetical protein